MTRATRWRGLLACLLFAAVAGALFGPSFPADRLFVPMHTEEFLPWSSGLTAERRAEIERGSFHAASDKLISFRADDQVTIEAMRQDEIPRWNPYNAGGVPHLGQGLYGVFYPFHRLYRDLDPERAWGFLAALHHLLAALFTYLYLRYLGARGAGATLGGLAFGFSTCLLARTHYYQYLETFCWLPLGLLLVEHWFRRGSRAALLALAPLTALVLLPGWPQTAVFTLYTWIGCAVLHSARRDLGLQTHKVIGAVVFAMAVGAAVSMFTPDRLVLLAFGPWLTLLLVFLTGAHRGAFLRRMVGLGAVLLLGAGIAMIQYLPAAEWGHFGVRGLGAPELLTQRSLRPWFLAELLLPGVFGRPDFAWLESLYNLPRVFATPIADLGQGLLGPLGNGVENALYFGVLPALLAPLALLARTPRAGFLLLVTLLFGGFACGVTYVVYPAYFGGFFIGSDARRALVVAVFALCCLAGLGLPQLLRRRAVWGSVAVLIGAVGGAALLLGLTANDATLLEPLILRATAVAEAFNEALHVPDDALDGNAALLRNALVHSGGVLLASALLALLALRRRWRPAALALLLLVLAIDLCRNATPYLVSKPAAGFLGPHPLIDHLQEQVGTRGRIGHYLGADQATSVLRVPLPPNLAGCYGLLDAWCYTVSPPKRWKTLATSIFLPAEAPLPDSLGGVYIDLLSRPEHLNSRALDLMAVRAIVGSGAVPDPLPDGIALDATFGESWVLRNERALPRVFTVAGVEDANGYSPDKIVQTRLRAENFDPRRRVLLEGTPMPDDRAFDAARLPTATLVDDQRERLRIELSDGEGAGVLVVLDGYDPGWVAEVDGKVAPVLLADYAFRAVAFPAGAREIVLRYEPKGVRIGALISQASVVLTALLLLIGLMLDRMRGRRMVLHPVA